MTPTQKQFLAKLREHMDGAKAKDVSDFVQKLVRDPPKLWECLEAFMTVSKKYGNERKSMSVYWGLASLALVWCEPYYALEFEYRSRSDANDEWSKRYAALAQYAHDEAVSSIAKKRAKATPEDFKRLERFKDIEEDVEAAKKVKPDTDPAAKDKKKFTDAFHKYMAARTKATRVELDKIIESLTGRPLEECLYAYIEASRAHAPNDEYSLYAFFGLSSRAMHWCGGYFALKYQAWIKPETKSDYATRYANLNTWQLGELAKDFAYANKRTRILDELRFAYYKAYAKDPDDRALRNFEAVKNDELRVQASGALAAYDRDCQENSLRGFKSSWDDFAKLLQQKDRLTLAMVVKWCRDWLADDRVMRDELYWYAVGALFVRLLLDRPEEYRSGFSAEEQAYLVSANSAKHRYIDDFSRRLRYLTTSRNDTKFLQLCKVHAALLLYGAKRRMRLATMSETELVYGKLQAMEAHGPGKGDVLTIPVTQNEGLLKDRNATVSIAQTYGDITIVWFDGTDTAYVECRGLEKVLFIMYESDYAHQLGDLTSAHFYDAVYEGTEGLLVLIPAFFQLLSYLPDLVTGGLLGLAKSIALQYVISAGTEAVLGDGPAGQIVASSLSIATGHWTQAESAATKNITAELRAAQSLEHGAFSARGVPLHGERGEAATLHFTERAQAIGAGDQLALMELHPVAPKGHVSAPAVHEAHLPPKVQSEHEDFGGKRSAPPPKRPTKGDKIVAGETVEEHDLLAAGDKSQPKKGGKGASDSKKRTDRPVKGEPAKKTVRKESEAGDDGVQGERGTDDKGKPPARKPPPPPRAPRQLDPHTLYATPEFTRSGVRYQLVGTGASFIAVENRIATRFQVYEIRNGAGQTVYVGITGGKTLPKDALDRLRQHLYTKQGEFLGDAASIHIIGVDLDDRVARALEDHVIDAKNPAWNNRPRDPKSYVKEYGQKPSIDEVRRASNANLVFRIDIL